MTSVVQLGSTTLRSYAIVRAHLDPKGAALRRSQDNGWSGRHLS